MNAMNLQKTREGFALVETVMSTVLVAILMVVSLSTFAHVNSISNRESFDLQAAEMAQFYVTEIQCKKFADPDEAANVPLGRDAGESSASRATFDDCDDYTGLSLSPLTDAEGNVLAGSFSWTASFSVTYTTPAAPAIATNDVTDLKLITLTITDPAGKLHSYQSVRSKFGLLQMTQTNSILGTAEISLSTDERTFTSATRIRNQQEAL